MLSNICSWIKKHNIKEHIDLNNLVCQTTYAVLNNIHRHVVKGHMWYTRMILRSNMVSLKRTFQIPTHQVGSNIVTTVHLALVCEHTKVWGWQYGVSSRYTLEARGVIECWICCIMNLCALKMKCHMLFYFWSEILPWFIVTWTWIYSEKIKDVSDVCSEVETAFSIARKEFI